MTANDDPAEVLHRRLEPIWATPSGWRSLSGVNHTTLGLRFIVTGFAFFLLAGVLAMLIRSQLAFPGNDLMPADAYNAAFTMHGTLMMFFFAVPILEGFAIYLVPKMIGARDMLFPRLGAYGYWCYLFGGLLLLSSWFFGAVPDGGWFMYTPLSGPRYSPGSAIDFWLLGVTFAEISAVAAAVELVVTILKARTPGMTLARMPIFVWACLVAAGMIVFGFPPLILAGILLELERAFGLPFYDPAAGGDPLLWQHLFWMFGHPEVYIIFLPAAGIVSMIVPTFARRALAGYAWIVAALVGTAVISFGLWAHHMFATGLPVMSLLLFSAASMAVAVPSGIQVFAWLATLWTGKPRMGTPLLFVMGFLFTFTLGGLTGVMVALVPFDWQAHDTHFVVAHLHYVLFGGMVFPVLAAFYYWLPLVTGREPGERLGRAVFWLIFVGFNVTFLPMHVTGLAGMPRRVYTYAEGLGWETLNLVSTVGGFLTAAGIAMFVVDLLAQMRFGRRAANAWQAGTLEWGMRTPVPAYNFASQPEVRDTEPLWAEPALVASAQRGEHWLGHADATRREMLLTHAATARPEAVAVLPGNTFLPLVAGLFTALFFAAFLAKAYGLALAGALLTLGVLVLWAWQGGDRGTERDMAARPGVRLPLHHVLARGPGWYGTATALAANAALYASLLFAWFFLWTFAAADPPAADRGEPLRAALAGGLLVAGSVAMVMATRASGALALRGALLAAGLAGVAGLAAQAATFAARDVSATGSAYGALVHAVHAYVALHVGLAVLAAAFVVVRSMRGYATPDRPQETRVAALLWHYATAAALIGFGCVEAAPVFIGTSP